MATYTKTNAELWAGRTSDQELYLHEKVRCISFDELETNDSKTFCLLGYACDEGVKRNQGRIGAIEGPDAIRKQLGKMPDHLQAATQLFDVGSIQCLDRNMEAAQTLLSEKVHQVLQRNGFPMVLGGGHDIAYGHYKGIKTYLGNNKTIGIINFDAHLDLRNSAKGNNSGTPFYQIAQECAEEDIAFNYFCAGIRKDANDKVLFETAKELNITYIENAYFNDNNWNKIEEELQQFMAQVDVVYTTIDLDGFSSAYAPGVSASSPMGFSPDIVTKCIENIIDSGKLISLDVAEMNPKYDIDNQTAKLAASLIHTVIHRL